MLGATITGDKVLDRKLRALPVRVQRSLEGQAIRAGMRIVVKRIKQRFPPRYRHLRTAVKSRYARKHKRTKGPVAKVGAGVGKQTPSKRGRSGGVHLSGANIHWAILGTAERRTRTGAYRGRMPPILGGVVDLGWSASKHEAAAAITGNLRRGIEREWKRA